ncbi:Xylulose kinase [subsurface metagenome]
MEGVVFALRDCLEVFEELGIKIERVIASGGGAKSRVWRQMQADIFNKEISIPNR